MSTWLITGCSSGLGRALAEAVIAAGHNVVPTARDVSRVADLGAGQKVLPLALDVTNSAQVADVVRAAEERFGGVDVLVNNAGYGYRSAVEGGGRRCAMCPRSARRSPRSGPATTRRSRSPSRG